MILPHAGLDPGRLHGQLVVLHPADHVEVQIGARSASSGTGGVVGERVRPDQPELLARPEADEDVALARLLRQRRRDGENGGRSRRVVVRAEMNLAGVVLAGQRVARFAVAEVIVVRADARPTALPTASTGVVAGR